QQIKNSQAQLDQYRGTEIKITTLENN
ncbi:chromosome segregation ATPase, partial [Lacticaseibacillus paracasei subsp. paracasei Lpp71]